MEKFGNQEIKNNNMKITTTEELDSFIEKTEEYWGKNFGIKMLEEIYFNNEYTIAFRIQSSSMKEIDEYTLKNFVEKNNDLFVIKKTYMNFDNVTKYYKIIIEN